MVEFGFVLNNQTFQGLYSHLLAVNGCNWIINKSFAWIYLLSMQSVSYWTYLVTNITQWPTTNKKLAKQCHKKLRYMNTDFENF